MKNSIALGWNKIMFKISIFNIIIWFIVLIHNLKNKNILFINNNDLFWDKIWKIRLILSFIYVVVCAIRSIYPIQYEKRTCLHKHLLSSPLMGRTIACIAELSFVALICSMFVQIIPHKKTHSIATIFFISNIFAQLSCTYGIITKNQMFHVIEESIWTLSAIFLLFIIINIINNHSDIYNESKNIFSFAMIILIFYIIFMMYIDIPMYYNRIKNKQSSSYITFLYNIKEIIKCNNINDSNDIWMSEIPWQSLCFSVAVWICILIANQKFIKK